jgi:cyclohexanecarboxylate-CoA ligase
LAPLRPTHWDTVSAARWRDAGLWPDEALGDTIAIAVRQWERRVAIVDGSTRLTFGRLDDVSRRLASALVGLGVSAGDVVCIQLPSWWEAVALIIASWRVGAVANPLLPNLRAREMEAILGELGPRVLVVPQHFRGFDHLGMADAIDHGAQVVVTRPTGAGVGRSVTDLITATEPTGDTALADCRPSPDAAALVLYTSGTSGRAKGVIHTHNTLRAEADSVALAHECSADDVMLATMPMAHIGGVLYGILLPLTVGLRAVLMDRWDPDEGLGLIEREEVTIHPTVPVIAHGVMRSPSFRPAAVASMRLVTFGGARVTPADVLEATNALGCWCKRSYGSTEMPTLTSGPRHDPAGRMATTDGQALGASEIRIVGDGGADLAAGTAGEIWCRGPELFVGYVDDGSNFEAFTADGWYRTGDLGSLDRDGFLTVTGRKKDVIIRGGENISPQEVEAVLLEAPEVTEVAIVAMPDAVMGERSCAFVMVSDPAFGFEAMVARVRASGLAAFKIPERLEVRDDLPRTPTGKIRKDALRAEIAALLRREGGGAT